MKLYTGDLSPYSAKVRMQIYAMGIEDQVSFSIPVEFMMGKMAEISPIGRIPVLVTDEGPYRNQRSSPNTLMTSTRTGHWRVPRPWSGPTCG